VPERDREVNGGCPGRLSMLSAPRGCAERDSSGEVGLGDAIGMADWPLDQLDPMAVRVRDPTGPRPVRAAGSAGVHGDEARQMKSATSMRGYIREGSLFRDNAAAKLGL
jgi:hypothetical protein